MSEVSEDDCCGDGYVQALDGGLIGRERRNTQRVRDELAHFTAQAVAFVAHDDDAGMPVGDSVRGVEIGTIEQGAINGY